MNFVARHWTNLCRGNLCNRNRRTVERGELNREALATLVNMDYRPDITRREAMLRRVRGQRYTIEIRNHAFKGYAVMKRGANLQGI